ncbi:MULTISPECIES: DUF4097 family beta strand repeat-containing protein [Paenibacillus]|uniref:DUF4097 domain-containing protein n=2 Tax=Paenibacillus lactis TaxID=228574 RepID=G4HKG9_9BACL|nr:DUF4097 family beta strand repeat-containing protein [Paenibacillus lactis]EHB59509.1 hypothetical protein PaelaDRAFT_4480 [Paenibacillus lactis 154]MBP1896587.1 DUF4097 and DUF4098 domain-containing protein YvlB [Paenibacillus lactis]MCM3496725.1 DUF4097 domain-containing protein [Paenibacillus lactis]GIO94861.1 hypothetical protein J31TS3_60880 [Paenibacillus lactis]HAG00338.1 protein liaG [Paenibacillus lactis]
MKPRVRVGRYTAAVLLISTGVLLLMDEWKGTDYVFLLQWWWPMLFVLLGMEYLVRYSLSVVLGRRKEFRFRPDLRGVGLAVFLTASVFVISQQEHFLHLWNRVSLNLTAAGVDYSEAADNRFDKPVLEIPAELSTEKIVIDHLNGDISIVRRNVDDIIVEAEIWVDQEEPSMAAAIAEQSIVEATEGSTVTIRSKGKSYGESGKRQPRINLNITLPDDRRFNMEVRTMNGAISLRDVQAIDKISLETGNGPISLAGIYGNVTGKTLNGEVMARGIIGDVKLSTNRGSMTAVDIAGETDLSSQVGNMTVKRALNHIRVQTRNGHILVSDVPADLSAESLNGSVTIRSTKVGGDWNIYSAVGEMKLHIPLEGDYKLEGTISYGRILTTLPNLFIEQKTISGESGAGEHSIKIEGNSDLNIYRSYPESSESINNRGMAPLPH